MLIPSFLKCWFIISALIVFYDASYCLLRPLSLKGGQYFQYYFPYENYIKYDTLYAANDDLFVLIQSWLNIAEGILQITAVLLALNQQIRMQLIAALIAIITSTMVFWKTVIFLWYDTQWTTQEAKDFTPGSILCYYFPSSFWIIMPILAIYLISKNVILMVDKEVRKVQKGVQRVDQKSKGKRQ